MRYSVQARDQIFVNGHGFVSLAKKKMGKNISQNISKYSPDMLAIQQNIFDHAKKSAKNALWTSSSRASQKSVEATGDLIGNKIANKITRVSKHSHTKN